MTARLHPLGLDRFGWHAPGVDWIYVGAGAFLGANARYYLGSWAMRRFGADFPHGTFLINVTGSLVIGLLAGLFTTREMPLAFRLFMLVGVLGGYTTFSSYSYETAKLFEDGRIAAALFYFLGSPLLGLAACFAGLLAGRTLSS